MDKRERQRLATRRWKERHPDYQKEYYTKNREAIIARTSAYNKSHTHEVNRRARERYNPRKIRYGDGRFYLWSHPRSGVCSQCAKEGATDMHHELGYFPCFPWFGIQELCKSCHGRISTATQMNGMSDEERTEYYSLLGRKAAAGRERDYHGRWI